MIQRKYCFWKFAPLYRFPWLVSIKNFNNLLKMLNTALRLLDIFQQFTFVIKQKKKKNEQHTNLIISNNTNKWDRQKE